MDWLIKQYHGQRSGRSHSGTKGVSDSEEELELPSLPLKLLFTPIHEQAAVVLESVCDVKVLTQWFPTPSVFPTAERPDDSSSAHSPTLDVLLLLLLCDSVRLQHIEVYKYDNLPQAVADLIIVL